VRAAEQGAELTRLAVAAAARKLFHDCRHRELRVQALEGWLVHIDKALAVVTRRQARGDASSYDMQRLQREGGLARARRELEAAHLGAARERLAVLVGVPAAELVITGPLLPELPAGADAEAHPAALRVLEQQIEAARLSARAGSRAWVPDLRLEAGYKGVELNAGGRTDGFLLGASLALPLWDHGAGQREASQGEVRERSAERTLLELELRGEIAALSSEASATRAASMRFREESARVSLDLVRITSAGYEGGELGLFELLDAYRSAAEDELTALDMELAARLAVIELDRLIGRGLP
jgi:cobalt-zinc-cadmium efflux system outer membrane protein